MVNKMYFIVCMLQEDFDSLAGFFLKLSGDVIPSLNNDCVP